MPSKILNFALAFKLVTLAATNDSAYAFQVNVPLSRLRSSCLNAVKKVFIDGEAGTTGLQVRDRLSSHTDIEILSPPDELRKDLATRKKLINEADAVILCLPDDASREAVTLVDEDNDNTVLIDASTAFRTDDEWTYGFPEMSSSQRESLAKSKRISNPGCYPTGFIALTRPLVEAGILPVKTPVTVNAISGYSGGGKALMEVFESTENESEPWGAYGFALNHKHIPEMAKYSKLDKQPIFQPQVAKFAQGMIVSVPLHYCWLKDGVSGEMIHDALSKHYEGSNFISVAPRGEASIKDSGMLERGAFLRPDTLKNTNKMELFVFDNDAEETVVLCARLDNLGKGASGAAVQNMNIALGFEETAGL